MRHDLSIVDAIPSDLEFQPIYAGVIFQDAIFMLICAYWPLSMYVGAYFGVFVG
jgi:hypothetical protein